MTNVKVKNAENIKHRQTKCWMGQRSTENTHKNESNKHRMGQNFERKKR